MKALLTAELLKLRTTRTFVAFVAAAVTLSLLITILVASIPDDLNADDARSLLTVDTSSIFVLLLGAIGMTGEWRHRTITSSVLAAPDRIKLVLAKLLAYAAAGALLSLAVTLSVALVSTIILSSRGFETAGIGDVLDLLWRNALIAALFAMIGVAVGAIVRNQVVAVVGLIVVAFVVEPAVAAATADVGKYLPFGGASSAILGETFGNEEFTEELLSPAVGVLVLLAWTAALGAIGALLLQRRDLT
jgi:hypothetical protein